MKRLSLVPLTIAATMTLVGPAWSQQEAPPSATDQVAAPEATEKEARHESERHEQKPKRFDWSFAGAFGRYDKAQLRRGFKVYKEVCSSCHSIKMLAFRNLSQPGGPEFPEKEVEALAASYKIKDGPNQAGEYFDRPGRPSDRFPPPFANEQAARAALAGNYPPDMSVLAKARGYSRGFPLFLFDALPGFSYQEHGVDYITSLMEGYEDPPPDVKLPDGQFYDPYMPGRRIGMPPPLSDGVVTYEDGAPQTIDQYAKDVAAFMMWVAEPHLEVAQASRAWRRGLPARLRRAALFHQAQDLVERAALGGRSPTSRARGAIAPRESGEQNAELSGDDHVAAMSPCRVARRRHLIFFSSASALVACLTARAESPNRARISARRRCLIARCSSLLAARSRSTAFSCSASRAWPSALITCVTISLEFALRAVVYRLLSMLNRRLHMHADAGQRISAGKGQRQSGQNREYAHSRRHCHLPIAASGLGFSLSKS